jgi:uncharacterized protein (TIGR02391 family)
VTRHARGQLALARQLQAAAKETGLAEPAAPPAENLDEPLSVFDVLVTEQELRDTARKLFADEHYALAVEEAFKCLNNFVKRRTGSKADGASLMTSSFSVKDPLLKLNSLKTQSQQDQQQGYMQIFAGCMTGIRNPRAHEHRHLDEPHAALEMLALANHLMRQAGAATRARRRRTNA